MIKNKELKECIKKREEEKNKLFELMVFNKSKIKVKNQFKRYEKAHNKALISYLKTNLIKEAK